jgi:hypothetical protein
MRQRKRRKKKEKTVVGKKRPTRRLRERELATLGSIKKDGENKLEKELNHSRDHRPPRGEEQPRPTRGKTHEVRTRPWFDASHVPGSIRLHIAPSSPDLLSPPEVQGLGQPRAQARDCYNKTVSLRNEKVSNKY